MMEQRKQGRMPEGMIRERSESARRADASGAAMHLCEAALDAAAFAHTQDSYERAEMVHLAIRASARKSGLSFIAGNAECCPYKVAYYSVYPEARVKLLSGVVLSPGGDDPVAATARTLAALDEIEGFDIARLGLPHYRQTNGSWAMTARRRSGGKLLVLGFPKRAREILPLADSYESFLAGLGKHTRRNLRNYRKTADASGVRFALVEAAPPPALGAKVFELSAKNLPRALPRHLISEKEKQIADQIHQFHSILSTGSGEIFSFCRGFIWETCAVVPYQLNDRDQSALNPSLLHRAYLAEWLIAKGVREIVFLDGCAGILRKAALPDIGSTAVAIPATAIALAKAVVFPFLRVGTALGLLSDLLPPRLRTRLGLREP